MKLKFYGAMFYSAAISLLLLTSPAHAAVRAWLDNDQIAPGDTVQLMLERDGQSNAQPDLAPLKQDFDVLSSSRSSKVQIVNGNMSAKTQLQLTLAPKHGGSLSVPAISWSGESSVPLALNVSGTAAKSGQSGSASPATNKVFLETKADQLQPYVQAAVNVTVRLYTTEPLYHAELDLPASSDVLVQQVGADRNSSADRNGLHYQLVERHYLLFPQHSGALTIPGAVLNAQIATRDRSDLFSDDSLDDFFGKSPLSSMLTSTKPIRIHGDSIALTVRPRPAGAHSSYWLPARDVTLTGTWRPDQLQAHASDPLTLDLHLQAEGLTAAQLPDLAALLDVPAGMKAYPDQAKLKNSIRGETVAGTRDQSIALIADQSGQFTLPELHVQWWDTKADVARETTLPSRTITILPGAGSASGSGISSNISSVPENNSAAMPANNASDTTKTFSSSPIGKRWQWISLTLALLWMGTLATWWLMHRRSHNKGPKSSSIVANAIQPDASRARREFHEACRANNAQLARRKLLEWIAAARPTTSSAPTGLRAFAKQLNDDTINTLLLDLDRACYAGGEWNGAKLLQALSDLPKPKKIRAHARDTELAPLYHDD